MIQFNGSLKPSEAFLPKVAVSTVFFLTFFLSSGFNALLGLLAKDDSSVTIVGFTIDSFNGLTPAFFKHSSISRTK